MQRFSTCAAGVSMLFALISAPLFHVHDHDDHGNPASFIHAQFIELEDQLSHTGQEIEAPHSHDHVRWLDVFTIATPVSAAFYAVAELVEPLSAPSPELRRAIVSVQVVRAHSPPARFNLAPRPPPSL